MYDKILVVSDNLELCLQFNRIIKSKNFNLSNLVFANSPETDNNLFSKYLGGNVISVNLKDDLHLANIISSFNLVLSIHCKQIFPHILFKSVKCINIHPGYNPINRGWFPQVFAIINDLKIGATIHEINEFLDGGKIIDRGYVTQKSFDTSLSLYNKVVKKEIELMENNIEDIIYNTYRSFNIEEVGNLFLKKDFDELLEINLDEITTVRSILNKLRALTHGNYKNAYYIDEETQKKVYVKISFDLDD